MIRTRTGCVTCRYRLKRCGAEFDSADDALRIRRVKCDETKPHCTKCTSTGRKCDGYVNHPLRLPRRESPVPRQTNHQTQALLAILPAPTRSPVNLFRDEDEGRSYGSFCSNSIPQTNRLVDSAFWSRLVLQIAHEEPAVKFSILSLGALQRCFELKQEQEKVLAISRYARAVHEARELVRRALDCGDHTKVLVCAILFHCIESALGHHVSAKNHLRSGLRLCYANSLSDKDIQDTISTTFRRFDLQAMTFWDASAPYEFSLETWQRLEATPPPGPFSSLNHAANVIMDLVGWMYYIHGTGYHRYHPVPSQYPAYALRLERCKAYMDVWSDHFKEYTDKHGTHLADFRQKCTLLTIYHLLASIQVRHLPSEPEVIWDQWEADFVRLLDLAETFEAQETTMFARGVLSFEMGIVVPLFETALRCRDPHQRRRAVAMLRSTPRREGIWDSIGAANVAQVAIELEEEGLPKVEKSGDVPDSQRVYFVDPAADLSKREVHVTFYRQPQLTVSASGEAQYHWDSRQRRIPF